MPPVQWNLKGSPGNSKGSWAAFNPQKWFTSTGALKPLDNSFRKNHGIKIAPDVTLFPETKQILFRPLLQDQILHGFTDGQISAAQLTLWLAANHATVIPQQRQVRDMLTILKL